MTNSHQPEDVAANNESSLKALVRAIRLSQGQFRLILVRCNYGVLRDLMVQRLRELSPVEIREIVLLESVKSLYTSIQAKLGDEIPQALMVFGLESASDVKAVLKSSNTIREEFSKHFPFPLVLWINDEVLKKLLRVAPDLESWATSVEFKLTTDELLDFLRQKTDEIFAGDSTPHLANCFEVEAACQDLQDAEQSLEPDLEASLEFVRGLDDFGCDRIDEAIEHYQKSLAFWLQSNHLERQGILLLNIARCYYRKAEQHRAESRRCWQESRGYLQQCLDVFKQAERHDLVTQHISKLGEILRRLQDWEQLKVLAEKALTLHQERGDLRQLAQDYGFLTEVALAQSRWSEANQLAQQALQILSTISNLQPHEQGLYRFLLARSQEHLGQVQEAVRNLEQARQDSSAQFDPQLYIDILGELRSLYFQQGKYLEAFEIKRKRRLIEYQYGFQAFAGASQLQPKQEVINPALAQTSQQAIVACEIAASGRERDVRRLIERISTTHHKLIVIHGKSGAGKSSILQAGLVPALKQQAIGERNALPVLVRVYTHWVRELGRALQEGLRETRLSLMIEPQNAAFSPPNPPTLGGTGIQSSPQLQGTGTQSPPELGDLGGLCRSLDSPESISQQLRKNADRNLLTVLIFDQFEEFFFVCTDKSERRIFFEFLRDCLNIGFVKVILSLRRDYLHYLLESEQAIDLDAINNNILDKNIRYPLGNFSPEEAKAVIQSLTERSQFYLQPELIDKLVQDLASKYGEVRPIELQVVGAQLQADTITTLEDYQKYGSKEKLVEKWLESVINDCGAHNEQAARFVLYFLTDDKDTRPLKTRAELVADLEAADLASEVEKLELVLQILVGSGLVLKIPDAPTDRYQLVHDYLVSFIRQSQQAREVAERKKDKEERQRIEAQLNRLLKRRLRESSIAGVALAIIAVSAVGWALLAEFQRRQAEINQIHDRVTSSKLLFDSHKELEALIQGLKTGQQLKQAAWAEAKTRTLVVSRLQQLVSEIRERNRLDGHSDWVTSVSFSPDGQTIASASKDETVKLWSRKGSLFKTLKGHNDWVRSVSFSPDGQLIASASKDYAVKLWNREGILLTTIKGHREWVNSVTFSPDSQLIASASGDKTVKLWSRQGRLLTTLKGHSDLVRSVSFSPDGQLIASASKDKTVKLWSRQGRLLTTLKGHSDGVNSVSFSPDGQLIASASKDNTVKLWSRQGRLLTTLEGDRGWFYSVSFSPNSQLIASASVDTTVKLWSRQGKLLKIFKGHSDAVNSVSFSPDGKILVSASNDKTVKLWGVEDTELKTLDLDNLLVHSCNWMHDYLKTNSNISASDSHLCDEIGRHK
jgi:WD40 repeat protein/tetratricopeptide (TPR) repeat protein